MRRLLSVLGLATLLSGALVAQAPAKKPSRVKDLISKMADTAATSAAATAATSLLGTKAGSVAGLVGAQPDAAEPSCPAGTMMIPTPADGAAPEAAAAPVANPGGLIVGLAKKKLLGKKTDAAASPAPQPVAGAPQFSCATPQQIAAAQNAQAAAAPAAAAPAAAAPATGASSVASGVGSMLAATPQGMLVTGAIAAAPMAGRGIKALGGMLKKVPKKDDIIRDLGRGRLQLKTVRFIEGSDALKEGFEGELAFVAEALQSVEGRYALVVPAESDGKSAPDSVMVRRRLEKLSTYLEVAGIPETRVSASGALAASLKARSAKPGEGRVELVRVVEEDKK